MRRSTPVTVRNARFQQWEALLTNRSKRHHRREFLVHGVRPITAAVSQGWPLHALLHSSERTLSQWAGSLLQQVETIPRFALSGELLRELGERSEINAPETAEPELVAVAEIPSDDLDRIPLPSDPSNPSDASDRDSAGHDSAGHDSAGHDSPGHDRATLPRAAAQPLVVAFDRAGSPGNIGTLVRSADAFGASGVVVTGHAADPYDPKAVRSSTGSLFALPVIRVASHRDVLPWAREHGLRVVGTDESGDRDLSDADLTGPTLLVVGNETHGMSRGWLDACDVVARLPMPGARVASSLNAATAGSLALYEAARQRG